MADLKQFFTLRGIKKLTNMVRVSGLTIKAHLAANKKNTIDRFTQLFESAVKSGMSTESAFNQVDALAKARKRETLNTLRNVMSAVRGQARAVVASGRDGEWVNISTLDGNTTRVCIDHIGQTWPQPYSAIPNKPPRVPPAHPCRSFLRFVPDGERFEQERPFMEQFEGNEDLQRDLLGPTRFAAFKAGELSIRSFSDFERVTLNTLEELGFDR